MIRVSAELHPYDLHWPVACVNEFDREAWVSLFRAQVFIIDTPDLALDHRPLEMRPGENKPMNKAPMSTSTAPARANHVRSVSKRMRRSRWTER